MIRKIEEVLPPRAESNTLRDRIRIFLAGTIDMGNSADWQNRFVSDNQHLDAIVYNPRRKEWDASWEQSIENLQFREQVKWELDGLERADIIIFHFEPTSVSMITLMELGLFAQSKKHILVHCPKGYMRKGNVDIVCERYNITTFNEIEEIYPVVQYLAHQKLRK